MENNINQHELEKDELIDELLKLGIFKKGGRQLFELSLCDLKEEYEKMNHDNQSLSFLK